MQRRRSRTGSASSRQSIPGSRNRIAVDGSYDSAVAPQTDQGDPGWPKYDLKRRATMRFDTTSGVVDDPRSAERALWEGVR
jgi:carboxylesterase type B